LIALFHFSGGKIEAREIVAKKYPENLEHIHLDLIK
jgi:hypothetical protein